MLEMRDERHPHNGPGPKGAWQERQESKPWREEKEREREKTVTQLQEDKSSLMGPRGRLRFVFVSVLPPVPEP